MDLARNSEHTNIRLMSSGSDTVDRMASVHISGNVTPKIWYKTIRKVSDGGKAKPYRLAIDLLAEIVYWYRPMEVRDESSGAMIGYRKRFGADLYKYDVTEFAETFGEDERSIRRALAFLEDELHVIRREIRTIKLKNGYILHNVTYVDLDVDVLLRLTFPEISGTTPEPPEKEPFEILSSATSAAFKTRKPKKDGKGNEEGLEKASDDPDKTDTVTMTELTGLPGQNCQGIPDRSDRLYTKINSNNISDIESIHPSSKEKGKEDGRMDDGQEMISVRERLDWEHWQTELSEDGVLGAVESLLSVIDKTVQRPSDMRIGGIMVSAKDICSVLSSLSREDILAAAMGILNRDPAKPVRNAQAYMVSALYNAPASKLPSAKERKSSTNARGRTSFHNFQQRDLTGLDWGDVCETFHPGKDDQKPAGEDSDRDDEKEWKELLRSFRTGKRGA